MREITLLPTAHFLLVFVLHFAPICNGETPDTPEPHASNRINTSSDAEAERAMLKLSPAPGLKVSLYAAEPLIANPVSFAFDEQGRSYVVETHRRRTSVYDIRRHPNWLDADMSFRSVTDRSNFFTKVLVADNETLPKNIRIDRNNDGKFDFNDLAIESERVRLLEDRNNDGKADSAITFAEDFNSIVSGVAAGILPRGTNVWFTCIPDLWLLRDTTNDGRADVRQSLLHGFGVHISFGGHDLHGLCLGPDGKLYFSIADRGLNVQTKAGRVVYPDSGAIMRCNPDGSEFELFATGLRNPQELAFDQFGNLWTGDNNGDAGDKARWLYVMEGSETGWHLGWQHLPNLGLWNDEKLWELHTPNSAAYILPPVAHIGHGPAGLAFYPGTGLPARYNEHFFLCDFPGGVRSFAVTPKGAGFEVTDLHDFLWNLSPVDVAFSPSGGAYVADWIEGWEKTGKGRIFRVFDPATLADPLVAETKKLLAEGMERRSPRDLARLLEHPDQRIRLEAQFALAHSTATNVLYRTALKNNVQLARLHAIWGLGQIGCTNSVALSGLLPLLADPDSEVRAQTAKVLGEGRLQDAFDPLAGLLADPNLRVRSFAAMAIGKLGRQEATEPLLDMLHQNGDRDPYLRHAGVMGLVWLNDINALIAAAKEPSDPIRMAALLALRRLSRPELAMFLYDSNPALVLEAARAIYDLPIDSALSQLAMLIAHDALPAPVMRRVIHANYRVGKLENAIALSEFAARNSAPAGLRVEALQRLGEWATPPLRDPLIGLWRPLPPRDARAVTIALRSELPALLREAPAEVRIAAIQTAVRLDLNHVGGTLTDLARDHSIESSVRIEALTALAALKHPNLAGAVAAAIADPDEQVRKEAARLHSELDPNSAFGQILQTLQRGSIAEKQASLETIAAIENPVAEQVLLAWLDDMDSGKIPPALQLDLLEAAAKRNSTAIKAKLEKIEANRKGPLGQFAEVLHGGNPNAGKKIFSDRADVACLRCHKVNGQGGEVGPDLMGIGSRMSREQILESILFPNNSISAGYETVVVTLKSGTVYAGKVKSETDDELVLVSPEDGLIAVGKSLIQSRDRGLSAMPTEAGSLLTKRELRDLIEYLAGLKPGS